MVIDFWTGWTVWGIESSGAGDTSCCGSFHSNRTRCTSWQSHWARRGERRSVFVCVCVQLGECICVGTCQETAELSGMRCLLHSSAVGVSIMRVTEGCLCVGECFSAFCVCICTVCVCVWVSFEMNNNIFSLPVSHGDKGRLLRLQPQWQWEMSQSPRASWKYTPTLNYMHTHRAESDATQTIACVVTVYLINYEYSGYFCIVRSVCQGERWANCAKNVCLLCGNAGKANSNKVIQAHTIFFTPIQIVSGSK